MSLELSQQEADSLLAMEKFSVDQKQYFWADLVLQRHMIMNYPEHNNVTSRLRYPGLAVVAAFAGHDVLWPADCVSDGIGLSRLLDHKPVSEPTAESSERLPTLRLHSEPVPRSNTDSPEFFSLRD